MKKCASLGGEKKAKVPIPFGGWVMGRKIKVGAKKKKKKNAADGCQWSESKNKD